MKTPPSEYKIDTLLAKKLLEDQHPDLVTLPISYLTEGWDNVVFRLGEDYLMRIPRREQAVPLLLHEQTWLPLLAARLPIAIPAPVRFGQALNDFPWPWSITPWFAGRNAAEALPNPEESIRMAQFLKALHQPAPENAPANSHRDGPLAAKSSGTHERLKRFEAEGRISPNIASLWQAAVDRPRENKRCLIHGDLHPKNIITDKGKIAAIIDWGDMTAGDPATDLASFWMLFNEPGARAAGLQAYAPGPDMLLRAKGWAVFFGAILLDIGLSGDPAFERVGQSTLQNLDTAL